MKKLVLLAWLIFGAQAALAQPPSYPVAPLPAWKQFFFNFLSPTREPSSQPVLVPTSQPIQSAPEPVLPAGKQAFFNWLSTSRAKPAKITVTAHEPEPLPNDQGPAITESAPAPASPDLPKKKQSFFDFLSLDRDFGDGLAVAAAKNLSNFFARECPNYHYWGDAEFLLWWVRNDPLSFPLVTTGNPNLPQAGVVGGGNATTLFGGRGFDYGNIPGTRLTLGAWLDQDMRVGLEAGGFVLFQKSSGFSAGSDNNGNPPIYIPAFNAALGREDRLVVSDPNLLFGGNVAVSSDLQLFGVEANGLYRLVHTRSCDLSLLGGFRFLDLNETFSLQNTTTDLALGNVTSLADNFHTLNQFFGGQIGARGQVAFGPVTAGLCAKVALGNTHQVVDINGNLTQSGASAPKPGTFPGGFFALPSNSGRQTGDSISFVPQIGARLGFTITPRLSAFIGYDFLLWTQVARPGDQIDRNLNPTQSQNPNFGGIGALFGPTQPVPFFNRSDFFAQGASAGLQFRY